MSYMLQPQIVLLREGTDQSQGRGQIVSNINATSAVAEILKTTLGPRGMDKMIQTSQGHVVTNDGATVIELLQIEHPAARLMCDTAKAQDMEVGDGTTSVILISAEILREAKTFIDEGMNPQTIISGYKLAHNHIKEKLESLAIKVDTANDASKREILVRCGETALNSKLLAHYKTFFAEMCVEAVTALETTLLDKSLIGIKNVTGGSIRESMLVHGVAFKKTFSYAGFEQAPKKFTNCKILLLNLELELKAEKDNAEVKIEKVEEFQQIVDAEWKLIYDKMDVVVKSGANVVLSKLPIGDLATQYFADRNIFCAGRVPADDMSRLIQATGGVLQSTVNGLTPNVLGNCGEFEEVQIGSERFNLFKECPQTKTTTIILRGGAEQFIQEAERSLNDAIMIVRRALKAEYIVPGGGAIEIQVSKLLKEYSKTIGGKLQVVINAFARALEVIPKTLADNAGLDSNDVVNRLRKKHTVDADGKYWGVDVDSVSGIQNAYEGYVWEPLNIKKNILTSATEAACNVLSIDETIKNPSQEEQKKMKKRRQQMMG